MKLQVNGAVVEVDADAEMPLLWVLRDLVGLVGTKYGCGMAMCGGTSAALSSGATRLRRSGNYDVYRVGAGTFEFSSAP